MAMGAETVRPFPAAGDGEVSAAEAGAAPVFLATEKDRPVDPMIWGDEKRMKRELMAWAKAVASMSVNGSPPSPSPPPSTRHRR